MSIAKRFLLVFTILISCVGCDQATKSVAKAYLSETEAVSLLNGGVRLHVARNYGAFLNLGASLPEMWRRGFLFVGVGAVLTALLAYVFLSKRIVPLSAASVALIVGGGLSNLIDRMQYGGYVFDFINVGIGPIRTGIFNFADVAIVAGVLLLTFGGSARKRAFDKAIEVTREKRAPDEH